MITEDYILRIIRRAAEFIVKALKLSKEGDFLTSEKTLENGLTDITGISIDTLKSLDAIALRDICCEDEASVYVLAKFLETLAEVEKQKGMLDLNFIYLVKSLEMYISIVNTEDYETEKPILTIYPNVREVLFEDELIRNLINFFSKFGDLEEVAYLKGISND